MNGDKPLAWQLLAFLAVVSAVLLVARSHVTVVTDRYRGTKPRSWVIPVKNVTSALWIA